MARSPAALLEMAFAGNTGISVDLPSPPGASTPAHAALFAEELGLVVEVAPEHEGEVLAAYAAAGVPAAEIGGTAAGPGVSISVRGQEVVHCTTPTLRDVWEATSFQLERLQVGAGLETVGRKWRWCRVCVGGQRASRGARVLEGGLGLVGEVMVVGFGDAATAFPRAAPRFINLLVPVSARFPPPVQSAEECVEAEQAGLAARQAPQWRLPFTPEWTPADKLAATGEASCSPPPCLHHATSSTTPLGCHPPPCGADKVRVAIIREEGSNGDREMAAAVFAAGEALAMWVAGWLSSLSTSILATQTLHSHGA